MFPAMHRGHPAIDGKDPSGYKWRAVVGAVAASLGLALLVAVLVLLVTSERIPLADGGDARTVAASLALPAPEPPLPTYRPAPRLLAQAGARPATTAATTQVPPPAPVTTFSTSFLPPEWIYGSTLPPPGATTGSGSAVGPSKRPARGPSPVSLALLVTELLLVHDVQRLTRQNDSALARALTADEEALALSSLFLSPGRIRDLLDAREKGPGAVPKSRKRAGGWMADARELIVDGMRLGGNLWKAYVSDASSDGTGRTALQCIWTLYCRNLEKMGALKGPFGLAGRMNGLGLRLAMKDAVAEDVFNFIAREMHAVAVEKAFGGETGGQLMVLERVLEVGLGVQLRNRRDDGLIPSVNIDCPRLFPRCSPLEAPGVVIKMVLADES